MPEKTFQEMLEHVEQKAGDYEELYGSCAQGTLLALQEEFNLGNAQTLKAATAMPGIALRGEACGAVVGAIMALGMAFGREKPDDFKAVQRTTSAARKLCKRFEEEFGGCTCREVQHTSSAGVLTWLIQTTRLNSSRRTLSGNAVHRLRKRHA